jgi:hypothetical protein
MAAPMRTAARPKEYPSRAVVAAVPIGSAMVGSRLPATIMATAPVKPLLARSCFWRSSSSIRPMMDRVSGSEREPTNRSRWFCS